MIKDSTYYRVHCWKDADERHITTCTRDDEDIKEARIEIFGAHRVEVVFRREPDEDHDRFCRRVRDVQRLMDAAHTQGQRHRAGIIKQAFEVKV